VQLLPRRQGYGKKGGASNGLFIKRGEKKTTLSSLSIRKEEGGRGAKSSLQRRATRKGRITEYDLPRETIQHRKKEKVF